MESDTIYWYLSSNCFAKPEWKESFLVLQNIET